MPFIESAIGQVKELSAVPTGRYPLRIESAEIVKVKKDNSDGTKQQIACTISIQDSNYPNAQQVYQYIGLVHKNDEAKVVEAKLRTQARFCKQFGIPFEDNGFNTDDFPGQTCESGMLTQEGVMKRNENDELVETGEVRNTLQLDRLPAEDKATPLHGTSGARGGRRRA